MKQKETTPEPKTMFLDFFKDKYDIPISRTEEGKICVLNIPECKKSKVYVHEGEQWKCRSNEEQEKKIIVTPLHMTLDAEENGYLIAEKAKILGEKYKLINK